MPFAIFGALLATGLRGLTNDVYFQIGLVTLIGLGGEKRDPDRGVPRCWSVSRVNPAIEAAASAARLRFRPIVMTPLAFILGVVPLAVSNRGWSLASRHSIGTGVIGGMLAATFIASFFIPMFYSLIARKPPKQHEDETADTPENAGRYGRRYLTARTNRNACA
ncbi:efflux RND transporter permease subunit, partial [Brucella abortus]|nr:efflux RND transporter permease subunit [Brucella abortus]